MKSEILHIVIKTIPMKLQRYRTCGDYWQDKKGVDQIRVSEMSDWRYCFLIALHEFIEYFLCKMRGIKEENITAFDVLYEAERDMGLHKDDEEPGDDKRACYFREHQFATKIEMLVASELKVSWSRYSKEVEKL